MSFLIEPAPAANDNEPPSLLDAPSAPNAPTALSSFSKTEALCDEGPFPQSIIRMTGRLMDAVSAACMAICAALSFLLALLTNL